MLGGIFPHGEIRRRIMRAPIAAHNQLSYRFHRVVT